MLKIRLRRMGAIRQPHYRIVVADARAPRDGDFIESLGHYNPLTNPSTIQIDLAKYEEWKRKGAQPTDAVIGLISQLNKAAAAAEGAVATAQPADRRTRTASGKRSAPEVTASAAPAEEAPAAPAAAATAETEEAPTAADGGEASEAVVTESGDEGTSANPGQASEEA